MDEGVVFGTVQRAAGSTAGRSSAASDVYTGEGMEEGMTVGNMG